MVRFCYSKRSFILVSGSTLGRSAEGIGEVPPKKGGKPKETPSRRNDIASRPALNISYRRENVWDFWV